MRQLFGLDEAFVRDVPADAWRRDALLAAFLTLLSALGAWVMKDVGGEDLDAHLEWAMFAIVVAGVLLALRRRFPVLVLLLLTGVHFVVSGELLFVVAIQAGMQVVYFLALYSAMAWAKNREALMWATLAVLLTMTVWIILSLGRDVIFMQDLDVPEPVYVLYNVALNVAYFGAATWLGRNAWLKARDEAELLASRGVIQEQGRQLSEKAILDERLRIARELHDSVAHHVALIGIQAAAARRTMEKKPEAAAGALKDVEQSSRQTVQELQVIVGSLRDMDSDVSRPDLDSLPSLYDEFRAMGLDVAHTTVGPPDQVSATQAATLYRVIQEALSNVRRHSSARSARVTLRVGDDDAQVEILDDGRPLHDTSGSGVGHIGIRERVAALGGTTQMGPRPDKGYRVLATIPFS